MIFARYGKFGSKWICGSVGGSPNGSSPNDPIVLLGAVQMGVVQLGVVQLGVVQMGVDRFAECDVTYVIFTDICKI